MNADEREIGEFVGESWEDDEVLGGAISLGEERWGVWGDKFKVSNILEPLRLGGILTKLSEFVAVVVVEWGLEVEFNPNNLLLLLALGDLMKKLFGLAKIELDKSPLESEVGIKDFSFSFLGLKIVGGVLLPSLGLSKPKAALNAWPANPVGIKGLNPSNPSKPGEPGPTPNPSQNDPEEVECRWFSANLICCKITKDLLGKVPKAALRDKREGDSGEVLVDDECREQFEWGGVV